MVEQAQSAFISYSRDDSEFALRLARDLKDAGAHVWLDQLDIRPGVMWDNAIEDALNASPLMLLVLSPSSSRSDNVRNEISFALEAGKVIIPVLYMDCVVPLRLQRNQRIDFRADYARGLTALLGYLQVKNPDPEVLEKAAEGDTQRHLAWQAREAEAERLRERQQEEEAAQLRLRETAEREAREREAVAAQKREEEATRQREAEATRLRQAEAARVREDMERRQREETARAAHEAEQLRLRNETARKAQEQPQRDAEAARIAEEKRKLEQGGGGATHIDPPEPFWKSGRFQVLALSGSLAVALVVIVLLIRSHSTAPTFAPITQGDTTTTPPVSPPAVAPTANVTDPSSESVFRLPENTRPIARPTAPNNDKAKAMFDVASALAAKSQWAEAAKAGEAALSLDPQSEDILKFITDIYHDKLFNFDRAYELDQRRVSLGYGDDDFVEASFTDAKFAPCASLAATRWDKDSELRLKIVMDGFQLACVAAQHNPVTEQFLAGRLRKEIAGLKAVNWTFDGTDQFVKTNFALFPNGSTWANLFDSLHAGDERKALAALTSLGYSN